MTLSACTSTFGGIVTPICFAVFRLMMNSNFFGCSTGIGGLRAFENLVHIRGGVAVQVGSDHAVGHEPTSFDKFWKVVYRWKPDLYREVKNLCSMRIDDGAIESR